MKNAIILSAYAYNASDVGYRVFLWWRAGRNRGRTPVEETVANDGPSCATYKLTKKLEYYINAKTKVNSTILFAGVSNSEELTDLLISGGENKQNARLRYLCENGLLNVQL